MVIVDIPPVFLTLGESSQFFPIENDIRYGFFIDGFDDIEVCNPLSLHGEEFWSRKDAALCQMLFQHLFRVSYGSYSFFY